MPRRSKVCDLLSTRWAILFFLLHLFGHVSLGQVFDFGCYWNPNGGPLVQSFPRATVPTDIDLGDVVALAGGAAQSIALHANGTISVWGDFRMGAATASPPIDDAVAIGAGFFHGLAIRKD